MSSDLQKANERCISSDDSGCPAARMVKPLTVLAILAALFILSSGWLVGKDFWWHVRTGQYIVRNKTIPKSDIYSYTAAGKPWVNQSWLPQIGLYYIDRCSGPGGLVVFRAAMITLAVALALISARARNVPLSAAGWFALLAAVQLQKRALVRPFLFSLVFWSVYLLILNSVVFPGGTRRKGKRRRAGPAAPFAALSVIMLCWTNCHAAFPLGFVMLGIAAAGLMAGKLVKENGNSLLYRVTATGLVCAALTLANPNGLGLWRYIFKLQGSEEVAHHITEWTATPFRLHLLPFWFVAFTMVPVVLASLALRWKTKDTGPGVPPASAYVFDLLLAVVVTFLGVKAVRHVEYAMLAAIPIYPAHLGRLAAHLRLKLRRYRKQVDGNRARGTAHVGLQIALILSSAGCIIWKTTFAGDFGYGPSPFTQPLQAVEFIRKFGPPDRIFNQYAWGGIVIRHFWPQTRVYIDTRSSLYMGGVYSDYQTIMQGRSGWKELLYESGADMLFLKHAGGTISKPHFFARGEWRCVYWDSNAVVAVRASRLPLEYAKDCFDYSNPMMFSVNLKRPDNLPRIFSELKRKVSEQPKMALAHEMLAVCSMVGQRFSEGASYWLKVLSERPGHSVAWFNLGSCYMKLGADPKAYDCRRKAYRLDSGNYAYAYGVGESLLKLNRYREAVPWFERALKLNPQMEAARRNLKVALDKCVEN